MIRLNEPNPQASSVPETGTSTAVRLCLVLGFLVGILLSLVILSNDIEGASGASSDAATSTADQMRLSVSPDTPWVKPGETVTVALQAPGGMGVSAAELTLNYGPDLEIVEVKAGPYLGKDTLSGLKKVDQELHRATYAWARIGGTPAQAPPGELAFITFKATEGYPWNTSVNAQVSLADNQFKKLPSASLSFDLHVYDRLPVPVPLRPTSSFTTSGAPTGVQPVFGMKTLSPGVFKYKIEVSEDAFQSVLHTFDQTASPEGWDQAEYRNGELAEFISPESLQPGQYQWRSYVWVQEVEQWGQPSGPEKFEVHSEPMGVSVVRPAVVSSFGAEGASVSIEGWGFTPDTQARWSILAGDDLPAAVQWENPRQITVTAPPNTQPGLVTMQLSRPGEEAKTLPVLVLPPRLFSVQTEFPWANQILSDHEFPVKVRVANHGTDPNSVAVIAVHLPNPDLFELVGVTTDQGGQMLDPGPDTVLLSARDRSQATFTFRLAEEPGAFPGSGGGRPIPTGGFLDFDLEPVVLGAVNQGRWRELEALSLPQRVEAVQMEYHEELGRVAQTFNQAPFRSLRGAFQQLASNDDSLDQMVELMTRLEGYGLDLDRIASLVPDAPADMRARLFPWDSQGTRCCQGNANRLQVVASATLNNLLAGSDGVGDQPYIAEGQPINYTIRFKSPSEVLAPVTSITVMAQLAPGMNMSSLLLGGSSHPDVMSVNIDRPRNSVTWVFDGISLPPDQELRQGEGWVRFSVRPGEDTPSGTILRAKAAVRFDSSLPRETNEVAHTLDSQAPSTQVSVMPSVQLSPTFRVPWEGGDEEGGSGIKEVALLASKNGGPFEIAETGFGGMFSFRGEPGATYALAAQGVDRVGHTEALPPEPDVVVTVGQRLSLEPGLYLLGIPVVANEHLGDLLIAPGSRWSTWDSAEQKYVSEKMGAGLPDGGVVRPGRGMWARFERKVEVVVTGQPAPDGQSYAIDLHAGWNLIANPFASAVPWSIDEVKVRVDGQEVTLQEAQGLGWVEDFLWDWNGETYGLVYDSSVVPGIASTMEPFRGYWMEAHRDLTLLLPTPGNRD